MMKRAKVFKILAMVLLLSIMLPTIALAETKEFAIDYFEEAMGLKARLEISHFKEDIPNLKGIGIETIAIDQLNDVEYEVYANLKDAFIVTKDSKIVVKLDQPTLAKLTAEKLTKRGDEYVYIYEQSLPITSGKIDKADNEDMYETYHSGVTMELNEVGEYLVTFHVTNERMQTYEQAFVKVVEGTITEVPIEEPIEEPIKAPIANATAAPTASKVLVNGIETMFDAYLIDGSNYFKLRDLSNVVNGSEKQFEVQWDGEKNAINLLSNNSYTAVGTEMIKGDGLSKTATLINSKLYIDGVDVELTAYTINGSNYFKLRDIAKAFDIGVKWDNDSKTVGIDTTQGYVE